MPVQRRHTTTAAITALLTIAAGIGILYVLGATESPNFPAMSKAFGGRANVDLIRHATKVEVFRVQGDPPMRRRPLDPALPTAFGYPIIAGPVTLDRAAARRLAAATTDPDAYEYDLALACIFDPGYVARFTTGDTVTEVAFCFHCGQIEVSRGRGLTMGPGRDRLLNELQAAFTTGALR